MGWPGPVLQSAASLPPWGPFDWIVGVGSERCGYVCAIGGAGVRGDGDQVWRPPLPALQAPQAGRPLPPPPLSLSAHVCSDLHVPRPPPSIPSPCKPLGDMLWHTSARCSYMARPLPLLFVCLTSPLAVSVASRLVLGWVCVSVGSLGGEGGGPALHGGDVGPVLRPVLLLCQGPHQPRLPGPPCHQHHRIQLGTAHKPPSLHSH